MILCLAGCETRVITARRFEVVRVIDGDTFRIMYDGEETSVRLVGIDAPERRQPGGPAATAALRKMIDRRTVRIEFPCKRKRDNFGRLLCDVHLEGRNIAKTLVDTGNARVRGEHPTANKKRPISK
jgi:micrococcal nuclease